MSIAQPATLPILSHPSPAEVPPRGSLDAGRNAGSPLRSTWPQRPRPEAARPRAPPQRGTAVPVGWKPTGGMEDGSWYGRQEVAQYGHRPQVVWTPKMSHFARLGGQKHMGLSRHTAWAVETH